MATTSSTGSATSAAINPTEMFAKLGIGSGTDTRALANSLVEAERAPQKSIIDQKIARSEAKISGYAAVNFMLSAVKDAFAALNDQTDFTAITAKNSAPAAFGVTASATAAVADHVVDVLSVARPQRSLTAGFAANDTVINSGNPFDLTLTAADGTSKSLVIAAGETTPLGVVDAINAKTSEWGVSAQLVNTGDAGTPYKILLTGQSGAAKSFTLAATENSVALSDFVVDPARTDAQGAAVPAGTPLQTATNAVVVINGLQITRDSNTIKDVVRGVSFDLYAPTTSAATVNLSRDASGLKDKLKALVTAYNEAVSILNVVTDPESEVEEYGATLTNDSTVRTVRDQLRKLFTATSSTPGAELSQFWQIGVSIDRDGEMRLDETVFDKAVSENFDDVVTMMTGNLSNQSVYSARPNGLAGDAFKKLTAMTSATGLVATQSGNADKLRDKYEEDLTKLERRLEQLLARYLKQFAAMDSIVGATSSLRSSLKSTFDGMAKAYG